MTCIHLLWSVSSNDNLQIPHTRELLLFRSLYLLTSVIHLQQMNYHLSDYRFIYWNSHFYGSNFYGWSIGDVKSLTESGPFHSQGELTSFYEAHLLSFSILVPRLDIYSKMKSVLSYCHNPSPKTKSNLKYIIFKEIWLGVTLFPKIHLLQH